jgi:cytochrome c oxidase subunit 2
MYAMKIRYTVALVVFSVVGLTACSQEPDLVLTPAAQEGRQIANSSGCSSCHGKNGQGVTAPGWQGIYLEPVELQGGGTVVADDDYLYRSITDPQADIVRDWTIRMPSNSLTDAEVAAIISYIKELS